ncbi:MAG: tyrosine-protein kinase family protein [Calditrichaeota bacterium]|nr:MAG: tyrosine-protein kinase family protein [Calditrichota bacterium]
MGLYAEALKKIETIENAQTAFAAAGQSVKQTPGIDNFPLPMMPQALAPEIARLQERIDYLLPNRPSRVIGFCGVSGGEGSSTIAYLLSLLYARQGYPFAQQQNRNGQTGYLRSLRKTHHLLLVDANVHAPRLHTFFGLPREDGLVEMIETDLQLNEATAWISGREFAVLTAGKHPRAATHIFRSSRLTQLLRRAREAFYTIILDFSAILQHPDILTLAEMLDGVVLISRAEATRMQDLIRASQLLEQNHARVLGVVVNRFREVVKVPFKNKQP